MIFSIKLCRGSSAKHISGLLLAAGFSKLRVLSINTIIATAPLGLTESETIKKTQRITGVASAQKNKEVKPLKIKR